VQKDNEGTEATPEFVHSEAFELLQNVGVTTEESTTLICEDYTDEEIKQDHDKVDWEHALLVIEEAQ